jgi:hypothetical protein
MRAILRCRTAAAAASLLIPLGFLAPTAVGAETPAPKPKPDAAAPGPKAPPAKSPPAQEKPPAPEAAPLTAEELAEVERIARLLPEPAPAAGLETAAGWTMGDWEDPCKVRRIDLAKCPVKALLSVSTAGGKKGKSMVSLTKDLALPEKGAARLTVYNPGPDVAQVAMAFWVSAAWTYCESLPQRVDPGAWKALEFDLAASNFKTEKSGWKHTAALLKRDATKRLGVVLMGNPGGGPAAVYVCGLGVDAAGAAPPAEGQAGPPAALAKRIERLRALLERMKAAKQPSDYFWPAARETRLRELLDQRDYEGANNLLNEALKDYDQNPFKEPKDNEPAGKQ